MHKAGLVIFASVEETDAAMWERMVNLGIHAPFHLVQAALPHMRRQGYGRIVLTTSGRAMRMDSAAPDLAAYCVVAATRVLRRHAPELRPEHVAPGVAFLASSLCNFSGVVLRAAGGRFSAAECRFGDDVDLGLEPVEPEIVVRHWPRIAGQT